MSLSRTLQTPEILERIAGKNFDELKEILVVEGNKYYEENSAESEKISKNLAAFGLPNDDKTLNEVRKHIILHYVEKIFPLTGTPVMLAEFIKERIDYSGCVEPLQAALEKGPVIVASPHFGGVEFIAPTISLAGLPINPVLKFSSKQLSERIRKFALAMQNSGLFADINFIELGRPNSMGAVSFAVALTKNEILFTVFDEKTLYAKPTQLFGKSVLGGGGLEKLLSITEGKIAAFTAFMKRVGDRYELKLLPIDVTSEAPVQQMYDYLEDYLRDNFVQWYLLREEIHFV